MHKIKIGIVDDHTIVRKGLISVIEEFDEFEVVMEAEHGKQLIDKIESAEIVTWDLFESLKVNIMGYFLFLWR